ncbi:MAG: hypothetical protein JWN43_1620 [Gammaproteobacteria bacterium]|nr:hypothetical protein [Gammaproteobacteria bacterium]
MVIRAVLILALAVLAACASRPPAASQEIFDEQSASTLLVVATPIVLARERSDVAAHARDYATMVAVEIDISGEYVEYLLLYRWSTVDRRMSPPPDPNAGALRIFADGRTIDLKPMDRLPVNFAQRRELHMPKHDDVIPRGYKVDVALLKFLASSHQLSVRMPQETLDTPFTLWEDGRGALTQFLKRAGAP